MSETREPWAFVAHRNGYWAGVASATMEKREIKKFLGEFAADGFSITTIYDRDEYNKLLSELGFWHDSPEYQAKQARRKAKGEVLP